MAWNHLFPSGLWQREIFPISKSNCGCPFLFYALLSIFSHDIWNKTLPRRESINFCISWLFKLFSELVSSFFIFLNILIIAKVEAISLPKIIYCQEAARPRQKNQRFIYVNQRSRQGGDVIFCHYFVILCHLWPSYYFRKHINAFAAPLLSEYLPDTLNKFPEIESTQFKETRNLWKSLLRAKNELYESNRTKWDGLCLCLIWENV